MTGIGGADLEELAYRVVKLVGRIAPGTFPYVSVGRDPAAGAVRGTRVPPWTAGFWLGQLHLAHAVTADSRLRDRLDLEQEALCRLVLERGVEFDHDIGFQMVLGPIVDHRTGHRDHGTAIHAACTALAGRFNSVGRFLRAHGWDGSNGVPDSAPGDNDGPAGRFIADTWMNLPLLVWGAKELGHPEWADIALAHAETARRLLTTEDGWVMHGFLMDPASGAELGPSTIQGMSPRSPWSRAQAWVIFGMPLVAEMLAETGALPQDEAAAWTCEATELRRHFLERSLGSGIAPWDFSLADDPTAQVDTSASAIVMAACQARAERCPEARTDADRLLDALTPFTAPVAAGTGILGGGAYHVPAGVGIDEPNAFGDFFFLQTICMREGLPDLYALGAPTS